MKQPHKHEHPLSPRAGARDDVQGYIINDPHPVRTWVLETVKYVRSIVYPNQRS